MNVNHRTQPGEPSTTLLRSGWKRWLTLSSVLVALVVAFSFWPSNSSKSAIRSVLDEDQRIAAEIDAQFGISHRFWNGSDLLLERAQRMDDVDLSDCPKDFQAAYKRHVMAWMEFARVTASNEGINSLVKGFYSGGMSALPAMSAHEQAGEEINATWSQVQQVAIAYGVAP
jgi:hypothetical protein